MLRTIPFAREAALELLRSSEAQGLDLTASCFSAAISCCMRAGRLEAAVKKTAITVILSWREKEKPCIFSTPQMKLSIRLAIQFWEPNNLMDEQRMVLVSGAYWYLPLQNPPTIWILSNDGS